MDDDKYLSDQDKALWRQAMGVEDDDTEEASFEELLSEDSKPSSSSIEKDTLSAPKRNADHSQKNKTRSGSEIDKRTDEKLRKGQMPIEAYCDLHGMTQTQAHECLHQFILNAVRQQKRCVLVITGKGKSRIATEAAIEPEKGVLKQRLPEWLSQAPLKEHILKFYPAKPKDGGTGAFYIYLRRAR
ncbi:MAG: Smr/MutS family protein [Pseudomonadota bacterium]